MLEHQKTSDGIKMDFLEISKRLSDNNFEVYIVGGYVRDFLMGKESNDVDLATNATPTELQILFSDCKINLVGTEFKVTVIDGIEVATYRKDYYDSSNPTYQLKKVDFAKTIEEDLARRDFTINSMAMDPFTGKIIDPFDGRKDLKGKKIKFVGNPFERIKEDPLRILRACRFICSINGVFDLGTYNTLMRHSQKIVTLPRERFRLEIIKALKNENTSKFFNALRNIDILKHVFPGLNEAVNLDGGLYHNETVYEHMMMTGDYIPSKYPLLKLGGYLHDIAKPLCYNLNCDGSFKKHQKYGVEMVDNILSMLKFSKEETAFVKDVVQFHMYGIREAIESKTKIKKFLAKVKNRRFSKSYNYKHFLMMMYADNKANLKKTDDPAVYTSKYFEIIKKVIEEKEPMSIKDLAVNGKDIMTILDIGTSKKVGDILKTLLALVIEKPELNNYENLYKVITKL